MAYPKGTTVRVKVGEGVNEVGTITDIDVVKTGKRGRPAINYTVNIGGDERILKSSVLSPIKAKAEVVTVEATTEEF